MRAIDVMLREHRLIERMLRVLEESADLLDRGGTVPADMLAGMLDFVQIYADQGHHANEEDIFFPALAANGLDLDACAIAAFRAQHESGRALVRAMRDALPATTRGDKNGSRAFAASAHEYVTLLREHISLENQHFAEYAEEYLSPREDMALGARMDTVDAGADRFKRMVAEYEEALLKC